ncbi:NACHT domain-containing protein [Tumidithrix helvetica]|uniref:NACHT domain-containing protein n=1 Tax=Tumidithrix helvetica TaxID=3457545 RepID=UPI003CC50BA1
MADIDALVREVRSRCHADIMRQCGKMKILNMEQAIALDDIYTDVQIFDRVLSKQFKAMLEYQEETANVDFNQYGFYGLELKTERIAGIEAVQRYDKLMVLGRPGAGKTTFLKRLALLCLGGSIFADCVPIFVTLQEYYKTKLSLFDFVWQKYQAFLTKVELQQLLNAGRGFVLLDGLDEVSQVEVARISKIIQDWAGAFSGRLIVTCRLAAKESIFQDFKEVQVADFNDNQVESFVAKWFQAKAPQKIEAFLGKLEANSRIKEQARNPLLLTLLCLIFEEETNLIENRAELYAKGIDLLLEKWDNSRDKERDLIYKNLSTKRKEDLLSQMAWATFGENNYFFKRERGADLIAAYIQNLPEAANDPETLIVDSKKILNSIEAQHGLLMERASDIYSFSHLTFHEYFVAREIITVRNSSPEAVQTLIGYLHDKRWREVFLIATEMSTKADDLLLAMKKAIDAILAKDTKLQKMLVWVREKAISVKAPYKPAALRAFYLDLTLALDLTIDSSLTLTINSSLTLTRRHSLDHSLDRFLDHSLSLSPSPSLSLDLDFDRDLDRDLDLNLDRSLAHSLSLAPSLAFDPSHVFYGSPSLFHSLAQTFGYSLYCSLKIGDKVLYRTLQALKVWLPPRAASHKVRKAWWEKDGKQWLKDLRQTMIKYRKIGYDWQFTSEQKEILRQYYNANKLLVDCLNSKSYVSREVRQHIEDTLLLPFADIKPIADSDTPKRGFWQRLFS